MRRINRWEFLRSVRRFLVSVVGLGAAWLAGTRSAQAQVPDLLQTLTVSLRPRVPADFAFLRRVVRLVNENRLPASIVLSTLDWVRDEKKDKKYKVPYFAEALRRNAARIGVRL